MMDCMHYRRSLLADPRDPDAALRAHRDTCAECAAFTERLLGFEARLQRALRVPVAAEPARPPLRASRARFGSGWLALAASVLLAIGLGTGLWLFAPGRSLAADVVVHMGGEPDAWRRTEVPVPAPALADVMADAHVRLAGAPGIISYASSCRFHGHQVPHLVMQTAAGPVTVMVLVHDPVMKTVRFDEEGYRGVIVPVRSHGSLAVLTQGAAEDLPAIERLAARVQRALVWD
jgi:Protein of unknown function (DUF3379)